MSKLGSRMGSKLGREARSILEAGRAGDDPTPADRARVKRALMRSIAASAALGATSTASAAGSATAAKATSIGLGLKLLGGVVVVMALGTGVLLERASTPDRAPESAATGTVAAPSPPSPPVPQGIEEVPRGVEEALEKAPYPPTPFPPIAGKGEMARSRPPAPFPPNLGERAGDRGPPLPAEGPVENPTLDKGQPAEDPLAAETRRLREAHGALQAGDPQKALTLLDEQGGQLGEERAAARVLALCQMGRSAEAEAARTAFLRDHPRSPLADRIRSGCAPATPR